MIIEEENKEKFCIKCGRERMEGEIFCPICGQKFDVGEIDEEKKNEKKLLLD